MSVSPLEGKWLGGPHNTTITITVSPGGEVSGLWRCPSGAIGEFVGKAHRSSGARCLWVDPDLPGAAARSVDQQLDIQLDVSGNAWTATASTGTGGGSHTWTASRIVPRQRRPGERLSTAGVCKDRDIFERLTRSKSGSTMDTMVSAAAANRGRNAPPGRARVDVCVRVCAFMWVCVPVLGIPQRETNLGESMKSKGGSFRNGLLLEMPPLCLSDPFEDPAGESPCVCACARGS